MRPKEGAHAIEDHFQSGVSLRKMILNLAPKVYVCVIFECNGFFFLDLKVAKFVDVI